MLDGKKIIVTGAANSIGRATVVLVAKEGTDVAVADIDYRNSVLHHEISAVSNDHLRDTIA
jgi:NAD(P)-dependent dehydrogenase (short-subunit alcohol dehydrogenase family)